VERGGGRGKGFFEERVPRPRRLGPSAAVASVPTLAAPGRAGAAATQVSAIKLTAGVAPVPIRPGRGVVTSRPGQVRAAVQKIAGRGGKLNRKVLFAKNSSRAGRARNRYAPATSGGARRCITPYVGLALQARASGGNQR
jgi:hypothetical protein